MTLRDAVRTATNSVSRAARELAVISSDPSLPIEARRRAYASLIELEVGQTWLRRARGLERDFDCAGVYLKFEGDNPTGTQKDRIAFAQVADAIDRGMDTVALATCGNYGVAVSLAAQLAGVACRVYVPAGYHTKRLVEMERLDAVVLRPEGSYEEVVRYSSAEAARNGWYDANPGDANAALQLQAYSLIADELMAQLPRAPDTVAVPVSNGTLMAGIYHGFRRLRAAGTIDSLPRMVAASTTHQNPIVASFLAGRRECTDLDPARIHETTINEPLINWHSFDGQEALDALYASGGAARNVSDQKLRRTAAYLREKESLQVLPASTAGLIALVEGAAEASSSIDQLHIAVLTAKR